MTLSKEQHQQLFIANMVTTVVWEGEFCMGIERIEIWGKHYDPNKYG